MTRSFDEYRRILTLWEEGHNKSEIERQLKIPRPTIRDCIDRYGSVDALVAATDVRARSPLLHQLQTQADDNLLLHYAYILGMYLGDGEISLVRKTYRIRITLDYRYPVIIQRCINSLQVLLPENKIGTHNMWNEERISCSIIVAYYKNLPDVFPQHGKGEKYTRSIVLHDWQQSIVEHHPLEFFRGFYHSDGSRFRNVVKGKDYPRYQFTNYSSDILKMFCDTCDRLNLQWTGKLKPSRDNQMTDVYISRRKDVAFLDQHIGAKT